MSNIYIQEPPTNGKVLLKTSCGELDIELWSKEAPKACRNFVQLCMEGYYDGTIFHRIIRNFMAQGGDPTGTGEGGESIYGHPFRDEFHSRLRFVRRGLVAMANAGPHDNGSQFFITLGPCEHLQGKHTIFGKIAGNTIYNALKLGEVDIGADDRPVYPPKIKATQVLANPFDDIIPRQLKKRQWKEEKKSKSKSKATKNFSLLSFGEEAEEDEEETVVASQSMKNKSKSMHDLVKDPNLSSVPAVEIEREEKSSPEERLHPKHLESDDEGDEEEEEEREEHERRRWDKKKEANDKKKEMTDKIRSKLTKEKKKPEDMVKEPPTEEKPLSRKEELQEESRKLKEELRDSRKRKQKQESNQEQAEIKRDEPKKDEMSGKGDELDEFHAQKKKFKAMRKSMAKKGSSREEQTLALLAKFQNKLHSAILSKKPEPEKEEEEEKEEGEYREGEEEMKEEGEEEEGDDWLVHSLQFDSHENKVKNANVKDSDTFTIFDPRNPMNKRRREDSKQKKKDRR